MSAFKEGLYDQLVTRRVREFLDLQAIDGLKSSVEELEENDYPDYLARHIIRQIKGSLRGLPAEGRKQRQSRLANALLDLYAPRTNRANRILLMRPPRFFAQYTVVLTRQNGHLRLSALPA